MTMQKADLMVFELSRLGFRLLRPGTDDCLLLFPWGQVHSWAQTETKFTFRYYDDM